MFPDQRDAELTGQRAVRGPGNGAERAVDDPRPDEEPWRPRDESGADDGVGEGAGDAGDSAAGEGREGGEPERAAAPSPESEPEIRVRTRRRSAPRGAARPARERREESSAGDEGDGDPDGDETVDVSAAGSTSESAPSVIESNAESEDESETEDEDASAESEAAPRKTRLRLDGRRRAVLVGAVAGVVALVLVWAGSLSSVQTILRQSFTKLPTAYTEMYLSGTPTVSGITLSVPVTVVNHATTQDSFTLKVWTVNGAGKTDTTSSIKVTPKHGEATVVVKVAVQISSDAQVLWINLVGQPQTLHYRIAGEAVPSPTATASATPTTTAKH